jgi:O-antigen/teichoic acid export membrane protein
MQLLKALDITAPSSGDFSTAEGRSRHRYRMITINSLTNCLTRIVVIAVSMITMPIVLSYLGKREFGLWTAITSFVTWLLLFDFGLVNGLVNAVSEAYGKEDRHAARGYVSTAFFLLVAIGLALLAVFFILAPRLRWDSIIGVTGHIDRNLVMWSVIAAVVPFVIGLPLSVVRQVYAGYQRSYTSAVFTMVGSILSLCALILAVKLRAGLPTLILILGSASVAASFGNLLYLVRIEMPWLSPALAMCSSKALRRLLKTSVPLFSYQVGALLVNQSQPIILAHRTNLEIVADYAILVRLSAVLSSLVILGTNAFLPSFREAFERGDSVWLRSAFKRMLQLRMMLSFAGCSVMVLSGNWLLKIWLHNSEIRFDSTVWIALAIYILAAIWVTSFTDFLTILDNIWIQVGLVAINGVVTVALTVLLMPALGVLGAIVAVSCVSVAILSWLVPSIAYSTLGTKRTHATGTGI